ncbi:retrotransposon protein, putative, ty1-copia subclass [Tanacetum coccineum]|uniref:Retrotransposon protein, putative, ty1-copia subclass n=1 Tax=Tanacetum coccineum TaxID=301880 RepID=A0ABQ5AEG2_9ASTR
MGIQFLQLDLRLGKIPSRSFRPVMSAKILWQFWASSSFGVSLAHDELKKNKASASGTSGIFTIELFSFPKSNSWIYDTGCGTHICNTIQGLRGYRKLNKGALDLYVGNGNTAAVEAIGSFDLILPSGMILVLDNCHFSPTITRGVISLSRLWDNGFRHKFMDNGAISVSKDNIVYFNAFPRDGIFEIDMHNHMSNERSIYTCSNKKTKHNLDSTFLWHCRLGHINKKRIEKLQHDGLLESIDDESFDVCVSCISGKMARKPFTHASERADDLLGIIHSDGHAIDSAARITQLFPTKKVNKTPYEMWHGKVPNLSYLKVWGCEALVKRDTPNKLESRSINTVDFDEIQNKDAQPSDKTSLHQHEVEPDTVEPQTDVIPVRRSARIPQAPERYGFYIDAEEHELGDHGEPPNYRAALSDLESEKWLEAMNAEMQSMKDNQVWNLVDLPPNCKTVGSKWLFKKKTDMDGNIHTYKARLVAKGFTQTYGVDYEETFSPVADIKAIRILIAIAAYYDYEIWQMDVKTAFLNGRLNEDVYMVQPEGFVNPKHPGRVCKLQRSIYGLKQASRSWNKRFDEEIKKYGFTQNPDEPCVYKRASGSIIVFLILYVDDILLMGNNIPMLQDVKSWLGKCFSMKDLGEAAYILGIKIYRDRSRRLIGLSQNAYIDKILKRFKMDTSKRGTIPMQPNVDLRKSQGPSTPAEVKRMKGVPYASAVKYLRSTKDMFIVYGDDSTTELSVTCYTDATEYIATAEVAIEAIWIRKFIYGLGVVPNINKPMDMYCDNTVVITIADEPNVQKGAKHFR